MPERLTSGPSAEERVFGRIFSLTEFVPLDHEAAVAFYQARIDAIQEGERVWWPRTLDGERGVVADLRDNNGIIATLDFDFDDRKATVYTTSPGGEFGDTILADRVLFEEAVVVAEHFAE